ncbi:MAG: SRPBCC family protein [Longimicrobiales bacterium]
MATASKTGATTITMPSDVEIVMTRVFDAPRKLLWDAWTSPEHVPQWMLGPGGWTMPVCEIDLRAGGAWHFVWRQPDGTEMEMSGVYREVKPPERLVATENWGGDWPETINTLTLTEEGGRTTVKQAILYPSKEARDAAKATGMEEGAQQSFDRLEKLLRAMA